VKDVGDQRIIESWRKNAAPWTRAVREQQIESRVLVTNSAIVDAVMSCRPSSVLDIGCGEGWLVRALAQRGVRGIGVDVVPELVQQAQRAGAGDFHTLSYDDLAAGKLRERVDTAVANFSLIGHEAVESLLAALPHLLNPGGSLVIQTLHPLVATLGTSHPYKDGWRAGSWAGFDDAFTDPAPWYFRTIESWFRLLARTGWKLRELREPVHPVSSQPVSLILLAESAG